MDPLSETLAKSEGKNMAATGASATNATTSFAHLNKGGSSTTYVPRIPSCIHPTNPIVQDLALTADTPSSGLQPPSKEVLEEFSGRRLL